MTEICNLGPYIRALSAVIKDTETKKEKDMSNGQQIAKGIGGINNSLAGIYLLYKGAQLHMSQI